MPYRHPVRAFLRIYGPTVAASAMGASAFLAFALDYALQPHGFCRFVVAIIYSLGA